MNNKRSLVVSSAETSKTSTMKTFVFIVISSLLVTGCTIVRQGEIGVKSRLGRLSDKTYSAGPVVYSPFTARIIKVPIRTTNVEVTLDLPSKEGLTINTNVSILYRIQPDKAPDILQNIGPNYQNVIILSVFRSAAADVTARFFAKDMHSGERSAIEKDIADAMTKIIEPRGFVIESVLLKSIRLPEGLSRAIENKLEAEQQAQRMKFVLEKEELEAKRKRIEAEGIRDAQKILSEGLTQEVLRYEAIKAFKELSSSSNAKVIITDSNTPMLVDTEKK